MMNPQVSKWTQCAPSLKATATAQCGELDLKTAPNHRAFHGRWQMRHDGGVAGAKAMAEAEPALPHLSSDHGRKCMLFVVVGR